MLAVLPSSCLLNLASVWKQTGRHLQPVRGDDAARFFGQPTLASNEAAQQKLLSMPLLIDPGCAKQANLNINDPHSQLTFVAPKAWLQHAESCSLALSNAEIEARQPSGDDEALITLAVERFTALRVKQRLEDTLDLPALSPTLQKIVALRSDPDASVDELLPIVRVDPSLSAQVMSLAASPYYAAPGKIASVEDAVIRVLGFDLVINMALATAMGRILELPKEGPRGGTPYWLQAVYNATLAEKLCQLMPVERRPKPGLVYLSGLLHNFGYLVLAHLFPPHFSLLARYIEANPHFQLDAIERQLLNVTREQIGAWLLSSWSLPEEVCKAIRHQNDPDYGGLAAEYAKIQFLTNRLLREQGLSDGPLEPIPGELYLQLGLTPAKAINALQQLMEQDEQLRELTRMLAA
ncbi:HDOD domain-containing protein [Marinobacterium arenosum]|uniref:HDOD domain-containing protein n=1 Tax=Marinobacterium arenosum TaxID=2862496 RepID=UPI001C978E51|nr:HDOD domain-containing protein [Marinobacterium arenosum]MBY4675516.1 HDOD domain-containing protein [Marinobacterium arenosum]